MKNIHFAGFVPDDKLISYYKGAKALIMPQEEDFGIVAVEAQSYGVSVIAFKAGGVLDTVIENKTGLFFSDQTVESIKHAILSFDDSNHQYKWARNCIDNAKKFSKENFKKHILESVNKLLRSELRRIPPDKFVHSSDKIGV